MIYKKCFFIGHREIYEDISDKLRFVIRKHIVDYGVTEFIIGTYGDFDRLALRTVIAEKNNFPNITISLMTPYHPSERKISKPQGVDLIYYPLYLQNTPKRFAIVKANQYIINNVDYLIAYAWKPATNSIKFLDYAKKRELRNMIKITVIDRK